MRRGKNISHIFPAQNQLVQKPRASSCLHAAGGGKELEGWELPARAAGFTPLPFVSPVLKEGLSLSLVLCLHSVGICSNLKGQLLAPRFLFSHLNPTCSASPPAPASPHGTPGMTHTEQQLLSRWSDRDSETVTVTSRSGDSRNWSRSHRSGLGCTLLTVNPQPWRSAPHNQMI